MRTIKPVASGRAQAILSTTLVLTCTTLFARTIVVYYNVYLSGKIGSVGIGIFELLMSVYTFAKTASTAGVSLATTRMSAEETGAFARTMRRILFCCMVLGILCAAVLSLLAPFLCASVLDHPPGGVLALQILACSLPFLSMSSAFGGYFVAKRKMRNYAPVQICEQLIRIGLTIAFLEHFSQDALSYSICAITLAITLSEVVAFLFSALFYLLLRKKEENFRPDRASFGSFFRSFSRLALPVGGGALFRASLNTVYNILVPFGLRRSGASSERSLASYGVVQGMALPILLYPSAVMSVVSLQLVPEIASLRAQNKTRQIAYITQRILHFALLFSITCAGILFFFAEELSLLVFSSTEAASFIRALAPLVPIMYLDTVTDGILKGLDLQLKVLGIGIIDSLLSLTLIYFLLPPFAMTGYLITIYAGECINTLLGQIELRRHVQVHISPLRDCIAPAVSIAIASYATRQIVLSSAAFDTLLSVVFGILAALCLCGALWCLTRSLDREELHWLRTLFLPKRSAPSKDSGR